MGEAFNREGQKIAEAFGATKADVLKAPEERAPDAAEVRIRTLRDQIDAGGAGPESPDVRFREIEPMEKFFAFDHLPPHLMAVSKPFGELAAYVIRTLPRNAERTVALRKLLEAKDCAVRSIL